MVNEYDSTTTITYSFPSDCLHWWFKKQVNWEVDFRIEIRYDTHMIRGIHVEWVSELSGVCVCVCVCVSVSVCLCLCVCVVIWSMKSHVMYDLHLYSHVVWRISWTLLHSRFSASLKFLLCFNNYVSGQLTHPICLLCFCGCGVLWRTESLAHHMTWCVRGFVYDACAF